MDSILGEDKTYPLIASYVNGTLKSRDLQGVEKKIEQSDRAKDYYLRQVEERDFLQQLIPQKKCSKEVLKNIKTEIYLTTSNALPKEKVGMLKKIVSTLNKPLFTIKY